MLQNLPSQDDAAVWENINSFQVCLFLTLGRHFFFPAYTCVVTFSNGMPEFFFFDKNICFQFDTEESIQMLPLPECWVVRNLF